MTARAPTFGLMSTVLSARLVTILQVPMSTATEVMSQALPWEAAMPSVMV